MKSLYLPILFIFAFISCTGGGGGGGGGTSSASSDSDSSGSGGGGAPTGDLTLYPKDCSGISFSPYGTLFYEENLSSTVRDGASARLSDGSIVHVGGRSNSALFGAMVSPLVRLIKYNTPVGEKPKITADALSNLPHGRFGHSIVPLDNKDFLIVGGIEEGAAAPGRRYDHNSNSYIEITNENFTGNNIKGVKLSSGKILLIKSDPGVLEAILFNPVSDQYETTTNQPSQGSVPVLLADGNVLISGGSTAEIYDSSSNSFSSRGTALPLWTRDHDAVLLSDGKVLVTGGSIVGDVGLDMAYLYDPSNDSFESLGGLKTQRYKHKMVRIENGPFQNYVFVIGGLKTSGSDDPGKPYNDRYAISKVEIYNPLTKEFTEAPYEIKIIGNNAGPVNHTVTLDSTGTRVFVTFGGNALGMVSSSDTRLIDTNLGGAIVFYATNANGNVSYELEGVPNPNLTLDIDGNLLVSRNQSVDFNVKVKVTDDLFHTDTAEFVCEM